MIDFGFDLAGRKEPRLWRGAALSSLAAITETTPLLVTYVVLDGVFSGEVSWEWMPWVIGILCASLVVTTALKAVGGIDNFVATYGLVCEARLNLADHLRRLPMGFWTAQRTGSVGSVITDEFAIYMDIVTHVWSLVVSNLVKPVAIAAVMIAIDWRLGLVAVAMFPFALASIPWSYRLLNAAADRLADTKSEAHARVVEYTQGIGTLREFDGTNAFATRVEEALERLEADQMRVELAPAPALFAYKTLVWAGFSTLFAVSAWMVSVEMVAPTSALLVALLSLHLYASASDLSNHLAMARYASRSLERIRELFERPVQPDAVEDVEVASAEIRIENVHFSYEDRPTLIDVSATLAPGTMTALVGPSGSGKSTLAKLVMRLWDVDEGSIRIGGHDLRDIPLRSLNTHVSSVLQDVVLFQDTVEENIRLGRPDAPIDEVERAATLARAHEFVSALPDGYDTILGEGGSNLSGGQRQRLSIARALLKDAPILVLDEATSSVDGHNERLIQRAMKAVADGRTVVVIAHRLWTTQHADTILVLDEGRIVERGTHDELLDEEGLYRTLWDIQQETREWTLS